MVLLCSSHVEPKKQFSDLKSLNKEHNFKITVVPMTEKQVDELKNQNINFNDLTSLNKNIVSSKKKK